MSWREAFGVSENQNFISPKSVPQMPEPRPRGNSGICGTGFRGIKNSSTAWGVYSNPTPKARETAPEPDSLDAQDWQELFDERAGIYEFDACMSRPEAEVQAFRVCVLRWLRAHPVEAGPDNSCAWCHEPAGGGEVILLGLNPLPVWAHTGCHQLLTAQRLGEASDALHQMDITKPLTVGEAEKIGREAAKPKG